MELEQAREYRRQLRVIAAEFGHQCRNVADVFNDVVETITVNAIVGKRQRLLQIT